MAMLPVRGTESGDVTSHTERTTTDPVTGPYPSHQYIVGVGYGDLAKGPFVCRRVAELAVRTDVAKEIRVMIKERMVDRVRERAGHEPEQDIELTREEMVQEYLQGVHIVDYRINEDKNTCSATAVMPKE